DSAIEASVKLSHRYIPGRQLPDKSVSLLDTACARVALSQTATPAAIEDARRKIHQDELNIAKLERENSASGIYDDRIAHLKAGKDKTIDELKHYEEQWEK
ncbi:hypothetical protein RZS08_62025, partial [Arthrospira platensis SPKY1]|nr:hypothetical protein [Arthrospira platensis SPKY1]